MNQGFIVIHPIRLRIILVDDHEIVRLGLKTLLSRFPQFDVVAEASDAQEAMEQVQIYQPDVVVMDIRLPGRNGIKATQEITTLYPKVKVIMLTSYADDDILFDAISAGASGYVLKQNGGDDLVRELERVGRGESLLDPAVTQKVFARMRQQARKVEDDAFSTLNDQELQILALIIEGMTNKEIAGRVFLSEKTVRNYVSAILAKLDLASRAEAAAYAVRHHILEHLPDQTNHDDGRY